MTGAAQGREVGVVASPGLIGPDRHDVMHVQLARPRVTELARPVVALMNQVCALRRPSSYRRPLGRHPALPEVGGRPRASLPISLDPARGEDSRTETVRSTLVPRFGSKRAAAASGQPVDSHPLPHGVRPNAAERTDLTDRFAQHFVLVMEPVAILIESGHSLARPVHVDEVRPHLPRSNLPAAVESRRFAQRLPSVREEEAVIRRAFDALSVGQHHAEDGLHTTVENVHELGVP